MTCGECSKTDRSSWTIGKGNSRVPVHRSGIHIARVRLRDMVGHVVGKTDTIEHWQQGSIRSFKIMFRDGKGFWHEVRWDGKTASFFALEETDERKACKKLLGI